MLWTLFLIAVSSWVWSPPRPPPGKACSKPQAALYNLVCFDDHINYRGQRNLIFLPVDLTVSPQLLWPPLVPVGYLKSAKRQNAWSKLPHADSKESLQVPSQGIKSGFCIVGFLSQFVETLAVYWIKVETPYVQKSQTRWLGRGILFYGKRNWVGWVDKNLKTKYLWVPLEVSQVTAVQRSCCGHRFFFIPPNKCSLCGK